MEKKSVNKILKVNCPQCDIVFLYYDSLYRPFCSERCKMIDLGHWFKESYKVPDKTPLEINEEKDEENSEEKENTEKNDEY